MEPISAVIRHPACAANPTAATIGAISRVAAYPVMRPAIGDRLSDESEVTPRMPIMPPTETPRIASTLAIPPPTRIEPLPQVVSANAASVWLRYARTVCGRPAMVSSTNVTWRPMCSKGRPASSATLSKRGNLVLGM